MTSRASTTPPRAQWPHAETDSAALEDVLAATAAAATPLADMPVQSRAGALRAVADALDAAANELVSIASKETALPRAWLTCSIRRWA